MEIDIAPLHNQPLFGSLSISPPASMFESFSPLLHFNDDILDSLNPSTDDDDVDDWLKPLSFDQLFEHDLQLNLNEIDLITEDEKEKFNSNFVFPEDEVLLNDYSHSQISHENEFVDLYLPRSSEQQIPSGSNTAVAAAAAAAAAATATMTTTTTTVRLIHQPKLEPTELPTTLYVSGNELQFRPILTTTNNHNNGKTIGHTYTTTTSSPITSVPIQSSIPIVPARVLKGKKFKRGGRVTARGASRNSAAAKRRLNSTAAEPKASVVIIAEDATRIDSKTTTLGLSSSSANDNDLLKSNATSSNRSSTRRRMKSTPREVILFRNGAFISKEPISKQQQQQQQQQQQPTTTLCFETTTTTTNNSCSTVAPPLHQQQITATGLQAAAQIVACNVLRQATFNDALIEQLIKREPSHTDDEYPIYCYSTPSTTSTSSPTMDEYENSCSTTLKILGCNTTAPLTPSNTTTTTTIELLTLAALQQQQQQQTRQQVCYIKQEPLTTTTTTTFLLPRLLQ